MPTRNVVLTPNQAEFIEQMVASGRYQNASEVLREGLRLLWQREEERLARTLNDKLELVGDDKGGIYLFDRDIMLFRAAAAKEKTPGAE